jgi:hypothetical protein
VHYIWGGAPAAGSLDVIDDPCLARPHYIPSDAHAWRDPLPEQLLDTFSSPGIDDQRSICPIPLGQQFIAEQEHCRLRIQQREGLRGNLVDHCLKVKGREQLLTCLVQSSKRILFCLVGPPPAFS